MVNSKTIGKRLRSLRGDKTIADVASDLGITQGALCNYENGIRVPRDEIKIKIAKYYNSSVEQIFFT
jgi:transcriptional regulator